MLNGKGPILFGPDLWLYDKSGSQPGKLGDLLSKSAYSLSRANLRVNF